MNAITMAAPPLVRAGVFIRGAAVRVVVAVLLAVVLCIVALRFIDPPVSALMLIRWMQGESIDMHWRDAAALGRTARQGAVAAEDLNFCAERLGVDFDALAQQIGVWRAGSRPAGASTIAMQTARNLFLWPGRSLLRKPLELVLAAAIAWAWPRRRQVEVYLNIAEFGPGLYGIEAASRRWFGRPAAALSPAEVARLLVLLPAPARWSPRDLPQLARARSEAIAAMLVADDDARLACVR